MLLFDGMTSDDMYPGDPVLLIAVLFPPTYLGAISQLPSAAVSARNKTPGREMRTVSGLESTFSVAIGDQLRRDVVPTRCMIFFSLVFVGKDLPLLDGRWDVLSAFSAYVISVPVSAFDISPVALNYI